MHMHKIKYVYEECLGPKQGLYYHVQLGLSDKSWLNLERGVFIFWVEDNKLMDFDNNHSWCCNSYLLNN